jgi:choline kinase
MEAILLAGGKGERLGLAAEGRPKPLVRVGGRPLAAYQVGRLVEAGVERVIVSCSSGQEAVFEDELSGLGVDVAVVA